MSDSAKPSPDPLWSDYALENLEALRSYSVSAAEALLRGDAKSSAVYFDCIRLCGREAAVAFKHIEVK